MKSIIAQNRNSTGRCITRVLTVKGRISELEDRPAENIHAQAQGQKNGK